MSLQRKMVDTATGASPPSSSTREMATSPISFDPSIQMITSDGSYDCSATINQEQHDPKEVIVMKEYA